MEKYGSRKFVTVMTAILAGVLALMLNKLTGAEFTTIISICVPAYLGMQGAADYVKAKNGHTS